MSLTVYPAPKELEASGNYRLFINGREIFCYDVPVRLDTTDWLCNTERRHMSSYAYFDTDEPAVSVRVEPVFCRPERAYIAPASRNIRHRIREDGVEFDMRAPDTVVVEINGQADHMLMIFANPPEKNAPLPGDDGVVYFGPGVHYVDDPDQTIRLTAGQTLYVAGGAVVYGNVRAEDADGVRICGRGTINGGRATVMWDDEYGPLMGFKNDGKHSRKNGVALIRCKNAEISGVCVVDPGTWTVLVLESDGLRIDGLKIIGYKMNSDGIDVCNSSDVEVKNCFLRCSDDCFVVKMLSNSRVRLMRSVHLSHSVLYADRASALEIGHECCGDELCDITYRDIDILEQAEETIGYHAINIACVDDVDIHDVVYEDIRVERCKRLLGFRVCEDEYSQAPTRGRVRRVTVKNVTCGGGPYICLYGSDPEHGVSDVIFENIRLNGALMSDPEVIHRDSTCQNIRLITVDGRELKLSDYPLEKCRPLDIRAMTNLSMGCYEAKFRLENKDYYSLPCGKTEIRGVPFVITGYGCAPDAENGEYKRAVIPDTRRRSGTKPKLELSDKAEWIFFLNTLSATFSELGRIAVRYEICYLDGSIRTAELKAFCDLGAVDMWSRALWQYCHQSLRLYVSPWRNPCPEKEIASIVMKDGDIAEIPILFGITLA